MVCFSELLACLVSGKLDGKVLALTLATACVALALRAVCTLVASRMSHLSSAAVKATLREAIFAKLFRLGASYREQVKTSEVVQVAVEGVDQLESYFGAYLPQFFYALLGAAHAFCSAMHGECTSGTGTFGVCAVDPDCDRCGADLGETFAGRLLDAVYRAW